MHQPSHLFLVLKGSCKRDTTGDRPSIGEYSNWLWIVRFCKSRVCRSLEGIERSQCTTQRMATDTKLKLRILAPQVLRKLIHPVGDFVVLCPPIVRSCRKQIL